MSGRVFWSLAEMEFIIFLRNLFIKIDRHIRRNGLGICSK